MIHNALYWLEEFHLRRPAARRRPRHHRRQPEASAGGAGASASAQRLRRAPCPSDAGERGERGALARARAGRRAAAGTPRNGTTTCTTSCTWRPPARATATTPNIAGDIAKLGRALAEGFAFQGEMMRLSRRAARRAERASAADRLRRLHAEPRPGRQPRLRRAADRVCAGRGGAGRRRRSICLAPQMPMLFMGEEWARRRSLSPSSATSGRSSPRRSATADARSSRSFPEFSDPAARERIPDPIAEDDVRARPSSAWDDWRARPHAGWLDWYRASCCDRDVSEIVPRLARHRGSCGRATRCSAMARSGSPGAWRRQPAHRVCQSRRKPTCRRHRA